MKQSNPLYLSVIIPAFNEEKKIANDVEVLYAHLKSKNYDAEVIVVDDGSGDKTFEVVKSLEPKYKNLKAVRYEKNRGKGHAVRTGVLQSRGEYVLFVDAGSGTPYMYVDTGLQLLQNGVDVAIGSRALNKSNIVKKQPKYRIIGSKIFMFLVHFFLQFPPIKDTQCGFKMFKKEAAQQIFRKNKIDGYAFDIETLLNAQRLGYKIKDFPITWRNDSDSRLNPFVEAFRVTQELIKIKMSR